MPAAMNMTSCEAVLPDTGRTLFFLTGCIEIDIEQALQIICEVNGIHANA